MKLSSFIKEKVLLICLIILGILMIETLLLMYEIHIIIRIMVGIIPIILVVIALLVEYYKKTFFYNNVKKSMQELEQKYLISEIIELPDFVEGKILKELMQDAGKSMLENVNYYKNLQEDYKEYIELWIHEVKIPIATSKLIIENNKDLTRHNNQRLQLGTPETSCLRNKNDIIRSIDEELDKIENYTEQALFYARSNAVEKDYIINKTNLKEIVNTAILKNKTTLLNGKVSLELTNLKPEEIYTDSKWATFIISQIIQNAIKYSKKEDKKIEISSKTKNDKVVLYIKDNGIGIKKGEITRVFERGFTGENGRIIGQKSTGIGLYLCKKLCDKLGIGIELNSQKQEGTEVKVIFPKNSYTIF